MHGSPLHIQAEKLLEQHFYAKMRKLPSVSNLNSWQEDRGKDALRISFSMTVPVKKRGEEQFLTRAVLIEASKPSPYAQLQRAQLLPDAGLPPVVSALI